VLSRPLELWPPATQTLLIFALCALHNFIRHWDGNDEVDEEDARERNYSLAAARRMREEASTLDEDDAPADEAEPQRWRDYIALTLWNEYVSEVRSRRRQSAEDV
jgi:hypothetical protein